MPSEYSESGTGGILSSGQSVPNGNYYQIATGGMSVSGVGTIAQVNVYSETATGGISVSGVGTIAQVNVYSETATGGALIAGDAVLTQVNVYSETATGGISVSGIGTIAQVNVYSETATGGALVAGDAVLTQVNVYSETATGGALIAGDAVLTQVNVYSETATGGALVAGDAVLTQVNVYSETATGGALVAGDAVINSFTMFSETGSGGVLASGDSSTQISYKLNGLNGFEISGNYSTPGSNLFLENGSGGFLASGSGIVGIIYYDILSTGGISLSGLAQESFFSYFGTGTITVSGASTYSQKKNYISTGSIIIGNSSISKVKISFTTTGSIVVSGDSVEDIIKYRYRASGTVNLGDTAIARIVYRYTAQKNLVWRENYLPVNEQWRCISYGNNTFVAPAYNSSVVLTSPDGNTWTQHSMPNTRNWYAISSIEKDLLVWDESVNGELSSNASAPTNLSFLKAGFSEVYGSVASGDIDYITFSVPANCELRSIDLTYYHSRETNAFFGIDLGSIWTAGDDTGLMIGSVNFGYSDTDSNLLSLSGAGTLSSGNYVVKIKQSGFISDYKIRFEIVPVAGYSEITFVAIAKNTDKVATSIDGINWTERTLPVSDNWESITYGNGTWIAVAYGSNVAVKSTDTITWTQITLPYSYEYKSIAYGNSTFVILAQNVNVALISTDYGVTWTPISIPPAGSSWQSITYGNGKFFAVSANGSVSTVSTNGITWTQRNLPFTIINFWKTATYGKGRYLVVSASSEEVLSSKDTINWTEGYLPYSSIPLALAFPATAFGNDTFVNVFNGSSVLSNSIDGNIVVSSLTTYSYGALFFVTASGGISVSGLSSSNHFVKFNGGFSLGGIAQIDVDEYYEEIASGGFSLHGSFKAETIITSTGGIKVGSSAHLLKTSSLTASGGSSVAGLVEISKTSSLTSSGNLFIGGQLEANKSFTFNATGGILISGNHKLNYFYYPDGYEIELSGSTDINVNGVFDLVISYEIYKEFHTDLEIKYDVGDLPLAWYRVEGCCKFINPSDDYPSGCEVAPLEANDPQCAGALGRQKYVQNILAKSVKELCSILKASNWDWTICKIGKFTRPPTLAQPGYDAACNIIEDQVKYCDIPECLQLCVQSNISEKFAYSFDGFFVVTKEQEATGSIYISGNTPAAILPWKFTATGDITVSGEVDFVITQYLESASGQIDVNGESDCASSNFVVDSSGEILLTGSSSVVSPYYKYNIVSGNINLSGETASYVKYQIITGVLDSFIYFIGAAEYPYRYYPTGLNASGEGIVLDVSTLTGRISGYSFTTEGNITIDGNASYVSPYYYYESSGEIVTSGTGSIRRNSYHYWPDGLTLTVEGESVTEKLPDGYFRYKSEGQMEVYNSFDYYILIYRYNVEDGEVFVSGNSDTDSSYKGIKNEDFGFGMSSLQSFNPNAVEPTTGISPSDNTNIATTACENCATIASTLYLTTNLFNSTYMKNMFTLNNIVIPDEFKLFYSSRLNSWVSTSHYTGVDNKNLNIPIQMTINFEFSCVNELGEDYLGDNYLKFFMMVKVKDTVTKKETKSRVLVLFPAKQTCYNVNSNNFDLIFSVSTKNNYVAVPFDVLVDYVVVNDDLGLFTNAFWNDNLLFFNIADFTKTLIACVFPLPAASIGLENY